MGENARRPVTDRHPVHRVHRLGSLVLGVGLVGFGVLGLSDTPQFFARRGDAVMGMGSNGALSVLSVTVGALLGVAAMRGGRASSTTSIVVGALFLVSGFVHLAVLDTTANVLAFRLPNVFFSFAAGLLLLGLGAYGRLSGGLPPDGPYAPGTVRGPVGHPATGDLADAEQAAATRRATPLQQEQLHLSRQQLAREGYTTAWRGYAASHSEAQVARLRADTRSESLIDPDR